MGHHRFFLKANPKPQNQTKLYRAQVIANQLEMNLQQQVEVVLHQQVLVRQVVLQHEMAVGRVEADLQHFFHFCVLEA